MRRVLITGATGLIGRAVVERLRDECEIWAVSRRPPDPGFGVRWVEFDLARPLEPELLPERVDYVVHLAQSDRYHDFPDSAADIFAVNTASTASLLSWADRAGVRSFVYASSGSVYGFGKEPRCEEECLSLASCESYYAASKRAAELLAACYASRHAVVVLRFFTVYGSGQRPERLVPGLVRSVAEGLPVRLAGQDGMRLNPIHVTDAAAAVRAALALEKSHVVNVAGPEVLSLREMAGAIGDVLGVAPRFERTAPRDGDMIGSIDAMRRLLHRPRVRFSKVVGELCDAFAGKGTVG